MGDGFICTSGKARTLYTETQRRYLESVESVFTVVDDAGIRIPFPHVKLVAPDAPIPTETPPPATNAAE